MSHWKILSRCNQRDGLEGKRGGRYWIDLRDFGKSQLRRNCSSGWNHHETTMRDMMKVIPCLDIVQNILDSDIQLIKSSKSFFQFAGQKLILSFKDSFNEDFHKHSIPATVWLLYVCLHVFSDCKFSFHCVSQRIHILPCHLNQITNLQALATD